MTDPVEASTVHPRSGAFVRLLQAAAWVAVAPLVIVFTVLGAIFLYFSPIPWAALRTVLAAVFVLCVFASFVVLEPRVKALGVLAGALACLLLWYS